MRLVVAEALSKLIDNILKYKDSDFEKVENTPKNTPIFILSNPV